MINNAINRNNYNVKINMDYGDGEMSMNLTLERCIRRKEPSHIAYDNMLGAG